jgi:NTP pyrophosphatase (non-canonical NTP hydrolase)
MSDGLIRESLDAGRVKAQLREFAHRRDWEQFHTPKNLCMALAGEVGELLSIFQWLSDAEAARARVDETSRAAIDDELADVGIYLLRLADVLDVDLGFAIAAKMRHNEQRFRPVNE